MHDYPWQRHYQQSNGENCGKKRIFHSYAEACAFNKHAIKYASRRKEPLHVYRCKKCQQFHIGHSPLTREERLLNKKRRRNHG